MAQYYTVQPGDTLFGIAERFGTTVQNLVNLNQIADPNLIFVGQRLLISPDGIDTGGGQGAGSRVIDGLLYRITTDQRTYRRGERVNITLTKTNITSNPIRLFYNTGQRFDFEAVRADGVVVWRWSEDQVFIQQTATITLQPGQSQVFRATWDQRNRQGNLVAPQTITIRGFNWARNLRNQAVSTNIVISRVTPTPTPTPTVRPPVCRPGVNLLENSGFEVWPNPNLAPPGWQGQNVARQEFIRHAGRYSARLGADARRPARLSQIVSVTPGRIYRLAYWVREIPQVPARNDFTLNVRVLFYNAAGRLISTSDPQYTENTVPESFIQFNFTTGLVPAAARTAEIRFIFTPESGNNNAVALDDVFFECLR